MKILVIHNQYQQAGGEYAAVEAQIDMLRRQGHKVVLYTKDNAVIRDYHLRQKVLFFANTVYSRAAYQELMQVVLREQPDVAHVHNVFPLISPAIYQALNKAGVPIIQTIHNFRFLCPNSLFYTHDEICELCKRGNTLHAVRRRCYRDSYPLSALYAFTIALHRRWGTFQMIDRFIVLSEFAAQKLVEGNLTTPDKITVLGNFLPDPLPQPGSAELREPYVIYIGRLSPEKGARIAIEAMAGLPGLQLKLLGTGPEADALHELVGQRKLRNVAFLGYVTGDTKWSLLRAALATVVPSLCYENFPLTILESMAAGTPMLASRLGSIPYLVEEQKTGLLFQPGDAADLRAKLEWMSHNPEHALKMGRYARQILERRFGAVSHYEELMRVYRNVGRAEYAANLRFQ